MLKRETSPYPISSTAVGYLLLFVAGTIVAHIVPVQALTPLGRALQDSLHAPGFTMASALAVWIIRSRSQARHPYLLAAAFSFALALFSEASQVFTVRDAELADFGANVLGIAAGLLSTSIYFGDLRRPAEEARTRSAPLVLAFVLCTAAVFPMLDILYAIAAQRSAIPNLATFENRWEKRLYEHSLDRGVTIVPSPTESFGPGRRTALVDIRTAWAPGLELFPFPDWSRFRYLSFTVASATSESLTATLRIHDLEHNNEYEDRYNHQFEIPVEPITIRIPLTQIESAPVGRTIDLSRIQAMIFFSGTDGDARFYIDNIRLE